MRTLGLIAVMVLSLLCAGCGQTADSATTDPIRDAVRAYNAALAEAYAQQDMNLLNTVATEQQAFTEFYQMAALGESRVRMVASLRSIDFGEVALLSETTASVTTTEVWDYIHESLDTSSTVRSETGVEYHLRYDLVLEDGRWLVDDVTSLDGSAPSQETSPSL